MDRSYPSYADSNITSSGRSYPPYADSNITSSSNCNPANSRDYHLRQLSKLSHKISKPIINKNPTFETSQNPLQNHDFDHPRPQLRPQLQPQPQPQQQQNLQNQPPVYNISKNDFRDLVQKLTGSPAHERISTPPPIQQPRPPSTRLQRIRPPPLAQINRPPPLMNRAIHPQPQPPAIGGATAIPSNPFNQLNPVSVNNFSGFGRPGAPLSPLPPFPTVHAPAESPVSAYMRYLQDSISAVDSNSKQFASFSTLAPLVSPRWNNFTPPKPHPEQQSQPQKQQLQMTQREILQPQSLAAAQQQLPTTQQAMLQPQSSALAQPRAQFQMPSSPNPFGYLNSPMSNYPLLSPGLLLSPSPGQLGFTQLPLSPTVPVPSPSWRGI